MSYPPMPWRLVTRGASLVSLHPVAVRHARAWVPAGFRIVPFLPGWTMGGLFVTEYGPGSDLRYSELIAAVATVWHDGRPCPWVTHLYVDSHESVEGGRTLLGVPKRFAPFARAADASVQITVGDADRPICRFEAGRRLWLWRQRVRAVSLHRDVRDVSGRTAVAQGNELRGRWGLARVSVEIPETSPLRALGFGRPLLGACARGLEAVLGGAAFFPAHTLAVEPPAGA